MALLAVSLGSSGLTSSNSLQLVQAIHSYIQTTKVQMQVKVHSSLPEDTNNIFFPL